MRETPNVRVERRGAARSCTTTVSNAWLGGRLAEQNLLNVSVADLSR
jgi:hypothetical protein